MSESNEPMRRETYVEHDVVYAAAGASAEPDLLRFPPQGSTPFEHVLRLGSGPERFLTASNTLMTWGAHRAVGVEVTELQQGDGGHYAGVVFDEAGAPEPAPEAEVRYGPDGEAFLTAGTTASLSWPGGKMNRKMRVVYVVDESRRIGFALGSADDEGAIGETAYLIEHRSDDTVWAIARGFHWATSNGLFGKSARALIRLAERDALQQLSVLAPGAVTAANGDEDRDSGDESAPEADPGAAADPRAE